MNAFVPSLMLLCCATGEAGLSMSMSVKAAFLSVKL